MTEKALKSQIILLFFLLLPYLNLSAQMITGTWKGKINRQKVEIKLVQQGDSLIGTSYYFESANNYRRYSIKGYFENNTNSVIWWDDQFLEEKSGKFSISTPGKIPLLSTADFNCPGGGKMMLDGKTVRKEDYVEIKDATHLEKINNSEFEDEWDFVIDNYTVGANDPNIIDSVASISFQQVKNNTIKPVNPEKEQIVKTAPPPIKEKPVESEKKLSIAIPEKPKEIVKTTEIKNKISIEEKFITREKKLIKEIPVTGDSIELRFYDNAEIDGDSISLFLNKKLLFQHIRLTGSAYIIKIAVTELEESNELIMVAENLGTIPPNTSYMVAIVGDNRYDALLASNEGSSAMIRLTRK